MLFVASSLLDETACRGIITGVGRRTLCAALTDFGLTTGTGFGLLAAGFDVLTADFCEDFWGVAADLGMVKIFPRISGGS